LFHQHYIGVVVVEITLVLIINQFQQSIYQTTRVSKLSMLTMVHNVSKKQSTKQANKERKILQNLT
jgi:hypothetical protein